MYRLGFAFALALLVAAPLAAADKAEKKAARKANKKEAATITNVTKQLEGVGLSEEQSKKVKELTAEYSPKVSTAQRKVAALLTAEQKKARAEAAAKAKADGVKGKQLAESIKASLKLTADQQTAFDAADKEAKEVGLAYRKAIADVLTAEQLAKTNLAKAKKAKKAK